MQVLDTLESEVCIYCRMFPAVFSRATGSQLFTEDGRRYVDFFSGAGVLNYGHNNPRLKHRLIEYLKADGIAHGLDMATVAKREFLGRFNEIVLGPRKLDYKIQFPGPAGTTAVEAALKLARKVTGRTTVIYFTNGFHGMTLGALSVSGNLRHRQGAGLPLSHTIPMPFDGDFGCGVDTLEYLESYLNNAASGIDKPAAIILETIQAEGGVRVARVNWLRKLARLSAAHGILFIVDDIQVGCGRTGHFFSFEEAALEPDMVCLSKSISGFGLPMALVLLKSELDCWQPGEHNGTFRGSNLAFVTATQALLDYWQDERLSQAVGERSAIARNRLEAMAKRYPQACGEVRGRGLILGLPFRLPGIAFQVASSAFERGLVIETAGAEDEVLKLLPPLVIEEEDLQAGLDIIEESIAAVLAGAAGPKYERESD